MTTLIAVVSILLIGVAALQLIQWWVHYPQLSFPWLALFAVMVGLISLIAAEVQG